MHERLYRSRDDRILFGVAGGMADWLDIDPAIVRIVWALLIFAAGTGVLLYIVAAIVIPEEPLDQADVAAPMSGTPAGGGAPAAVASAESGGATPADAPSMAAAGPSMPAAAYPSRRAAREAHRAERRASRGQRQGNGVVIFGVILIALGGWLLARTYLPFFDDRLVGPAFLVVVGILLVVSALNRPGQSPPS